MAGKPGTRTVCGIAIPGEQLTPLVESLLRVTASLPNDVTSHFGPTLQQYMLYQHFHNHVTQPLLHEELRELGIDISAGQVNRLLTEGHEAFHQEKDSLLPAAREVSAYLHTDDTSAKHQGKDGHTLHIGNDLFASFFTTDTKDLAQFNFPDSPGSDSVSGVIGRLRTSH